MSLSGPADSVVVSITDKAGVLRQQFNLGPQPAGVADFTWDGSTLDGGTAADGTYNFTVKAVQGGNGVDATALAYGQVTAVSPAVDGAKVTVGNLGTVAIGDVKQVVQ